MGNPLDLETVDLLAKHLTPIIRDTLRSEFDHLRRNYQQADQALRDEFEAAVAALRAEHKREMDEAKARIAELEKTKWWVSVSYGGIVAFVTALYHLATKLPLKKWFSAIGSG